jgi:hypothetical protein
LAFKLLFDAQLNTRPANAGCERPKQFSKRVVSVLQSTVHDWITLKFSAWQESMHAFSAVALRAKTKHLLRT